MRNRDLEGFDRWLPQARSCAAPDLQRFAAGLEADLPAVRAAFNSPSNSGQVEGQINRLKYLKRQMEGRAKLDLLRIRILHPNRATSHRLTKTKTATGIDDCLEGLVA